MTSTLDIVNRLGVTLTVGGADVSLANFCNHRVMSVASEVWVLIQSRVQDFQKDWNLVSDCWDIDGELCLRLARCRGELRLGLAPSR